MPGGKSWLCLLWHLLALLLTARSAPAISSPKVVYTFDARPLNQLDLRVPANLHKLWDTLHVLAAMQGLANRQSSRLYLLYCSGFHIDTDQFWFDWFRGEDGWLKDSRIRPLATLEDALKAFPEVYKGLVVYSEAVPATSNLASTAAGCDDLLPVRFDPSPGSVFDLLVNQLKLPVKLWLVNRDGSPRFTGQGQLPDGAGPSSGSAKVDAYRWAIHQYLRSGRCAPGIAAYYVDAFWLQHPSRHVPDLHTLSNHDFFIARGAFFFDLSPWDDEQPGDDPHQPLGLDRKAFLEVLRALYDRSGGAMVQVGGFPPWPFKYTTHSSPPGRHDGVPTEWEFGRLISQFNGYMEADAAALSAMANASFYQHYPLAVRYPQPNPRPTLADWRAKGYVTPQGKVTSRFFVGHYAGDYDSAAWLYKTVPSFFRDPARGEVPLGWAFDPNLSARAPQAFVYAYHHATTNDYFIAGDSGAGYLNPRALTVRPDSCLPPGLEAWTEHCRRDYERWGMSITGFILDGAAGASTDLEFAAYRTFSPDGAGTHFEPGPGLHRGLPTCREQDLPDDLASAEATIVRLAQARKGRPGFLWARGILRPPHWYAELSRRLAQEHPDSGVTVVDPYTFFGLVRLNSQQGR